MDRQTNRSKTVFPPPPPGSGGIIIAISLDVENEIKISSAGKGKGLRTKNYGVISVQRSLVDPFAIFSFQSRQKCRNAHYGDYHKNDNQLEIETMNQT